MRYNWKNDYLDSQDDFVPLVTKQDCSLFLPSMHCDLQSAGAVFWRAEQEAGLNSVHKAGQLWETWQHYWLNFSEGPSKRERHAKRGSRWDGGRNIKCVYRNHKETAGGSRCVLGMKGNTEEECKVNIWNLIYTTCTICMCKCDRGQRENTERDGWQ